MSGKFDRETADDFEHFVDDNIVNGLWVTDSMQKIDLLIEDGTSAIIPIIGNAIRFRNDELAANVTFNVGLNDYGPPAGSMVLSTVGMGLTPDFPDFLPFYQLLVNNTGPLDADFICYVFRLPENILILNAIKRLGALRQ